MLSAQVYHAVKEEAGGRAIMQIQIGADMKRADADQSTEQKVTAYAIGKVSLGCYSPDDHSGSRAGNHVLGISGKAILLFTDRESAFSCKSCLTQACRELKTRSNPVIFSGS